MIFQPGDIVLKAAGKSAIYYDYQGGYFLACKENDNDLPIDEDIIATVLSSIKLSEVESYLYLSSKFGLGWYHCGTNFQLIRNDFSLSFESR